MKKIRHFVFIYLFLSLTPSFAFAENVRVTAKAFPSKITIGDEIRLVVGVERPKKYMIDTPTNNLKISPFEIKRVEVSPVQRGQNRVQETFTLVLTVFEMGDLTIPSFPVRYRSDSGKPGEVMTEAIPIKVASVGKKATDKEDIRSIKGPASFNLRFIKDWVLGSMAVALSIFLVVKVILRRRKRILDPESLLPADERARRELERLKKTGYLQEKKLKEYYSELSNILRRYFERQYLMLALELTTEELVLKLRERSFTVEAIRKVQELLERCDLVKFAKLEPAASMATELEGKLLLILDETKPVTVTS